MLIGRATRRDMLHAGIGLGISSISPAASGFLTDAPVTLNGLSPERSYETYIKLLGSLDSSDVYIWFSGVLWGVIPSRLPIPICGFHGLAKHRWTALGDGNFIQKAYDVGFFSDLETGLPIDRLTNPITRETNDVYHNKYGGFEQQHSFQKFYRPGKDGKSRSDALIWKTAGNQMTLVERPVGEVPTRLAPEIWPRESSGPTNYYGGETSYSSRLDHLLDPKVRQADYTLGWLSIAPWEPWLLMDGTAGTCQWNATGMKLRSYKEAPKYVLEFVAKEQPNYFEPGDPWEGYLNSVESFKKDRKPVSKRMPPR